MGPQPFSKGNYELNEKCDNHDDWWCLFYWSLLICTGHGQSPWRGPSVWWLQCTQLVTHSSPKRSRTVEFLKKRQYNKIDIKPWNGGPETDVLPLFCAVNHLNIIFSVYRNQNMQIPPTNFFHLPPTTSSFSLVCLLWVLQWSSLIWPGLMLCYLMSKTFALTRLSMPLTTSFRVPPHASLPSGGLQCGDWSATSPHPHIHLWGDWNKSELLSGPRPPCNWILPCFTECNKA